GGGDERGLRPHLAVRRPGGSGRGAPGRRASVCSLRPCQGRGRDRNSCRVRAMESQYADLKRIVGEIGPCLVAFSGGVDSTFLLKVARDVLGDSATAVTAVSPSLAAAEREEARFLARLIGAPHRFVRTREMEDPRYTRNDAARCYYCKSELFGVLAALASRAGGRKIVYGAIADDVGDDRPGMRAAAEADVRAPLIEAGMSKDMVRALSRRLGLPT